MSAKTTKKTSLAEIRIEKLSKNHCNRVFQKIKKATLDKTLRHYKLHMICIVVAVKL